MIAHSNAIPLPEAGEADPRVSLVRPMLNAPVSEHLKIAGFGEWNQAAPKGELP